MARSRKPVPHPSSDDPPAAPKIKPQKRKRSSSPVIDWAKAERGRLRSGFRIKLLGTSQQPLQPNKRRKLHAVDHDEEIKTQESPFEGSEIRDVRYKVEPSDLWKQTRGTRECKILELDEKSSESFYIGDYVWIRPEDVTNAEIQEWLGKVLEIRKGDSEHVYIRIYWMYRPEDLNGGRQPYHGERELIASNDMAIISAQTVECKASIIQWDGMTPRADMDTQLYWRQSLDVSHGKEKLSKLPNICYDRKPCNPDKTIQCGNCGGWLHEDCVEEAAVRNAYETHNEEYPETNTKSQARGKAKIFRAKLRKKEPRTVVIHDNRKGSRKKTYEVPVECLTCGQVVDQLGDTNADVGFLESNTEPVDNESAEETEEPDEEPDDEGMQINDEFNPDVMKERDDPLGNNLPTTPSNHDEDDEDEEEDDQDEDNSPDVAQTTATNALNLLRPPNGEPSTSTPVKRTVSSSVVTAATISTPSRMMSSFTSIFRRKSDFVS